MRISEEEMREHSNRAIFEGFTRGADAVCDILEDTLERMEIVEQAKILEELSEKMYYVIKNLMEELEIKAVEADDGDDDECDGEIE